MAKSNILQKLNPVTPSEFVKYIEQNIGDLHRKQFSNEDLAYVNSDEFFDSNADGFKVWYSTEVSLIAEILPFGEEGTKFFGIAADVYILMKRKKAIPKLLVETFLKYYVKYRTRIEQEYPKKDLNELLNYLVDNNEEDILELVAFDEFKFDNFDLKVVELLNDYYNYDVGLKSIRVGNLERVKMLSGTGQSRYIKHPRDPGQIPGKYKDKVDPYLFETKAEIAYPLQSSEGYEDEQGLGVFSEFSFNLNPDVGFSKTNIQGTDLNSNVLSWFSGEVDIRAKYNEFLLDFFILLQLRENKKYGWDQQQARDLFNARTDEFTKKIIKFNIPGELSGGELPLWAYIAKKVLDDYRYAAWKNILKEYKKDPKAFAKLEDYDSLAQGNIAAGEAGAADTNIIQGDPGEEAELSEKEIEARQKFLKQCMLMTQLDKLADENLKNIADVKKNFDKGKCETKSIHLNGGFAPYKNRFYMVQDSPDGDQSSMINKLLIPNGQNIREFLDARPSTQAYLVPKLRFYKVYTNKSGNLAEFRFDFRTFTDPSRIEDLATPGKFDRGGDYGVKEFNFSFDGTTPATAKNDIKANLSLYFQSFNDFTRKQFRSEDGELHAFVDLLLLPAGKNKTGSGAPSIFQYDASYYRIRVDVGWEINSTKTKDQEENIGVAAAASLARSLRRMNKSFYLNMVDHTMDFRDDGSIQIDVEYRAYIESALKGTTMDALASRESRKALKDVRRDYETVLSKNRCSAEELNEIRIQLEQIEELLRKQSYQSIMKRLIDNGSILHKIAKDTSEKEFIRRGIFTTKVEFETPKGLNQDNLAEKSKKGVNFKNSKNGFSDLKNGEHYKFINYFYLGDLLYAILDCVYDDRENYLAGFEKFKFVLGSFQYEDLLDSTALAKTINLANIPISCELFYEWFTENIIKPERLSYPIMFFIRDLCNFLLVEILSETCFKRSFDKRLQFKTMNFLGAKNGPGDPLGKLFSYGNLSGGSLKNQLVLDVGKKYAGSSPSLPLAVDSEAGVSINDLYNYVTIYAETPRIKSSKDANTTRAQDEADGIMHYQIGRDRGILKRIKFNKSDMQYIREARFFRHGNDGLMQLSAVYKVTLEMFGNTLYYPGMEIFIDPLGLLGVGDEANPRRGGQNKSVANKLGFGGYHLVTNVKSSIGPGKFTTTVEAMFSYAGDGDPTSSIIGSKEEIKGDNVAKIDSPKDNRNQSDKNYCSAVYNNVIDRALDIQEGASEYNPLDHRNLEKGFNSNRDTEVRTEQATGMTAEQIEAEAGVGTDETPLETLQRQIEEEEEQ